jgi:enterochelin esterase-like enzyme
MKTPPTFGLALLAGLALGLSSDLAAQQRARAAAAKSPELLADGRVTFRYRASAAKEINVSGQFGDKVTLTKGEDGTWTGTTAAPVKPGVHEYRVSVDGLGVPDALNAAIKPQRWPGTSILHVPATPPALWDMQEIPHGNVHQHSYKSAVLGTWRDLVVYTPPGVEAGQAAEPLPVLYLAHGFSDNQATWTAHGKAHWILDALIAQQQAVPMIIVMPDAHALTPGDGWRDDYGAANTDAFCEELLKDVIPLIESKYPVKKSRENRAFAGLSMGGRHALTVALRHSDQFAYVGAFSSAPPDQPTLEKGLAAAATLNANLKYFWVACGKADFLFQRNEEFHAALEKGGIKHTYAVTDGDHSWPIWREYLAQFAPKLFR